MLELPDTSQNHRVVEAGRGLWRWPGPSPGELWLCSEEAREVGDLSQSSVTLTVKSFLAFRWNFLCFRSFSLPLGQKSLTTSSWRPPFRYLYTSLRSPLSLLQAEQAQLSQPLLTWGMLQSPNYLCSSVLGSPQYAQLCFVLGSPVLDPALHKNKVFPHSRVSPVLTRKERSPPLACYQHYYWWLLGHKSTFMWLIRCPPLLQVLLHRAAL